MWWLVRNLFKLWWALPWLPRLTVAVLAPVCALNLTVATVGSSLVFPLSPYFLTEKASALGRWVRHLPHCVLYGHGDVDTLTRTAELRHGLPAGLMQAVVAVESGGRAHRISGAGAMGPAQLMPGTAAMLQVSDPFDPPEAIDAGARYLAQLLKRTGDVALAVASYNAGPGAVNGRVPRNGETEFYVARVMKRFRDAGGKVERPPAGAPLTQARR